LLLGDEVKVEAEVDAAAEAVVDLGPLTVEVEPLGIAEGILTATSAVRGVGVSLAAGEL
jgi:hypothetical protein